jgi:hypothetical protein
MRGFGSPSICSDVRTPSPQPSPLWGEGVHCASCCVELSWQTPTFSRRVLAPEFFGARLKMDRALGKYGHIKRKAGSGKRKARGGACFRSSVELRQVKSSRNKMKEAERRQTLFLNLRILRCGSRPFGARSLVGVPPRLSPQGIIPSQRLGFRPGFLGLGLYGRYPPSPVPVQGSTSHPGRNAGRHDAQAAREQAANPPAGTALAPMTRCASAPCPSLERGW